MEAFSDYVGVCLLDLGEASAVFECGNELGLQLLDLLQTRERDEGEFLIGELGGLGD